jgi:hypothetical protein
MRLQPLYYKHLDPSVFASANGCSSVRNDAGHCVARAGTVDLLSVPIADVHADAIEGAPTPLQGSRLCCGSSLLMSALNLVFSRLFRIICGPAAVDGRRTRHAAPSPTSVARLQERNPAASVPKGFK